MVYSSYPSFPPVLVVHQDQWREMTSEICSHVFPVTPCLARLATHCYEGGLPCVLQVLAAVREFGEPSYPYGSTKSNYLYVHLCCPSSSSGAISSLGLLLHLPSQFLRADFRQLLKDTDAGRGVSITDSEQCMTRSFGLIQVLLHLFCFPMQAFCRVGLFPVLRSLNDLLWHLRSCFLLLFSVKPASCPLKTQNENWSSLELENLELRGLRSKVLTEGKGCAGLFLGR